MVTGAHSIRSQVHSIVSGNANNPAQSSVSPSPESVSTHSSVVPDEDAIGGILDGGNASKKTAQHPGSLVQSSTLNSSPQSPQGVKPQGRQSTGASGTIQPSVIRTGMMSLGSPSQPVQSDSTFVVNQTTSGSSASTADSQSAVSSTQSGGGVASDGAGVSPVRATSPDTRTTARNANDRRKQGGTSYPLEYEIYKQKYGASAFNEVQTQY